MKKVYDVVHLGNGVNISNKDLVLAGQTCRWEVLAWDGCGLWIIIRCRIIGEARKQRKLLMGVFERWLVHPYKFRYRHRWPLVDIYDTKNQKFVYLTNRFTCGTLQ